MLLCILKIPYAPIFTKEAILQLMAMQAENGKLRILQKMPVKGIKAAKGVKRAYKIPQGYIAPVLLIWNKTDIIYYLKE